MTCDDFPAPTGSRFGAVVPATVVAVVVLAATPLPPSAGLLLGALTGMAVAAFGDRSDEPGPDTFDTYPEADHDADSEDGDGDPGD
jgi:hypothetical protein